MPAEAFRDVLQMLTAEGRVTLLGERVAIAGHRVVLSRADTVHLQEMEESFRRAALNPPLAEDVVRDVGGVHGSRLLGLLVEQGRLVKIRDGPLFHGEALEDHGPADGVLDGRPIAGAVGDEVAPLEELVGDGGELPGAKSPEAPQVKRKKILIKAEKIGEVADKLIHSLAAEGVLE